MRENLPKLPLLETIIDRLPLIFPAGTDNRNYLVREIAAKTIFVMIYLGAVEGYFQWARPDQVTRMSDGQAEKTSDSDRLEWIKPSLEKGKNKNIPDRWYSGNTRESIRDETIRHLILSNAVYKLQGLPTTTPKPTYALRTDFVGLFDESLLDEDLTKYIEMWQETNLGKEALARLKLVNRAAASERISQVLVNLPNGEIRRMSAGPSSVLSKNVIEVFAKQFLVNPAVISLSESSKKIVVQDDEIASSIGLNIKPDQNLPDIILADLTTIRPIFVFVEVVITDGPVSISRREALMNLAIEAGFRRENIAFLTAFRDRGDQVYKRLSSDLAWASFVWFASEPENIIMLKDKEELAGKTISDFL